MFGEMLDWMLTPFLLIWPLSIGITYVVGVNIANDAFDQTLSARLHALAEQVTGGKDIKLLIDLRTLLSDDDVGSYSFRIDDRSGKFLLGDEDLPRLNFQDVDQQGPVTYQSANLHASRVRIAAMIRPLPSGAPPVMVTLGETFDRRETLAREIMKGIVLPQLIVVPLMILLMWIGLRRGAAPLEKLRKNVAARTADDLRPLDAVDAPVEVLPMINAFNDLLVRVEREGQAQRRFIANAAHQLRTPLAGIKMQAELARRSSDADVRAHALENIAAGTVRTAHLVTQLLVLARAEASATEQLPLAPLNICAIAQDAVAAAFTHASAKQIDLGFEGPDGEVSIMGHADLLRELLNNLVDNAVRYTSIGGRVTVRIIVNDAVQLEVDDDGVGIALIERVHVFERFYRVLGNAEPGSGIGLAIVREIAARHAATVSVDTPISGKGSVFRVRFSAHAAPFDRNKEL